MKRLLIAAMALASLTATAQKKDKPVTDKEDQVKEPLSFSIPK